MSGAFYRTLPANLVWSSVRKMGLSEAARVLPRPGLVPMGIGAHFVCLRADDVVIKLAKLRSEFLFDDICYELIKATVPRQHLVEQSIASVGLNIAGFCPFSKEVLIQPFVQGIKVERMLYESSGILGRLEVSVYPEFRSAFCAVAPFIRNMLYNPNIDPRPGNFIATPEGGLVYIDYRMPPADDADKECRTLLDRVLTREGF